MICFVVRNAQAQPFKGSIRACQDKCKNRELSALEVARLSLQRNLSRTMVCPLCGGPEESAAVFLWQQLTGEDEMLVIHEPVCYPPAYSPIDVKTQLLQPDVVYSEVAGLPSAMAKLETELAGLSLPAFLDKHAIPIAEAIKMGLTFEMIVGPPENWKLMLEKKIYRPEHLVALGATFTRLLCAGMPLQMFIDSRMDVGALHMIQFNRHAFDAAGGTEEQWAQVLEVAKNVKKMPFKFGAEYKCETCRPNRK